MYYMYLRVVSLITHCSMVPLVSLPILSEANDTDQSVALMVAKVTIDTDRKSVTETSIDIDNDHMNSYGDIKSLGMCYIYTVQYYSGCAVLIILIMEEEEEMVGRQFNSFEGL